MSKGFLLALILLGAASVIMFFEFKTAIKTLDFDIFSTEKAVVSLGGSTVFVEVADTPKLQTKGLSGKEKLDTNEGMLFIFKTSGIQKFWMKDMNFPIDIIWINEDKKIISITENATPESYPRTFSPSIPVKYVLEVNAGFTKARKITLGQTIIIEMVEKKN